ncbi:ankyrin repeat domain-containing protein [Sphingomicrobium flavum]|uniref:ankyrin repeat domain-containing protein n=1 Tax=Sphingomicrobium flavum TaxID=1229164 RepID=UPI0021ADD859|nr:ankyrin repeat domain-containing protein [Sphingomicrobium flavum]
MRLFLIALSMIALAASPASAQKQSEGETFLAAVRDLDAGTALPMIDEPGSRIVNFKGYEGDTALHIVAEKRSLQWLNSLLRRDADTNAVNRDGDTAMIIAARLNWQEGIERLVRYKADVNKANRSGVTPLMIAVQVRNESLVDYLMSVGANPDVADYSAGLSARDYARRDNRNPGLLAAIEKDRSKKEEASEGNGIEFGPVIEFPAGSGGSDD